MDKRKQKYALLTLLLFFVTACVAGCVMTQNKAVIEFSVDSGYRIDYASNPFIQDQDGEAIILLFESRSDNLYSEPRPGSALAYAEDGLHFDVLDETSRPEPKAFLMESGVYRRYQFDPDQGGLVSFSSLDGELFEQDEGLRYEVELRDSSLPQLDFGVLTYFQDSEGGIILLHNRTDETGAIVVDQLYAAPETDGLDFQLIEQDILHGTLEWAHYADPNVLVLSNGDVRLVVMNEGAGQKPPLGRQGGIYTYISHDEGMSWELEGLAFSWEDFDEFSVRSLNDPKLVELSDGRTRIYVAALIPEEMTARACGQEGQSDCKYVIVSATSK